MRLIRASVVLLILGTVASIVAVWPSPDGRAAAQYAASEIGLSSDRIAARVFHVETTTCSYASAENPELCIIHMVTPESGPNAGERIILPELNAAAGALNPDLEVGDRIIVGYEPATDFYFYADRDRRTVLWALTVVFALTVLGFGRAQGLRALIAMAGTVGVFIVFIAPSVLDGHDPLLVSITAASAIAIISLPLTHGWNRPTQIALAGTLGALGLIIGLSWAFFELAQFSGLASEDAITIPLLSAGIDMGGLILGGAILGALGALDDVTVTQVAAMSELRHRSPDLDRRSLFGSGLRIGRDHIASTVNTLLLAYLGVSMPLVLLLAVIDQPISQILNSELIAVEVARTLCGSIGLVAAVPLTTAVAAAALSANEHRHPAE